MTMLQRFTNHLQGYWSRGGDYWAVQGGPGFPAGFAAGATLVFLLVLLVLVRRQRRRCRCRGVRIEGEGGELFVSLTAVREFVRRLVQDIDGASFHSLDLRRRQTGYVFDVSLDVVPESDLPALQERLNESLRSAAGRKLGIEGRVAAVNVAIHRLAPGGGKRRSRKETAPDREDDREDDLPHIETPPEVL